MRRRRSPGNRGRIIVPLPVAENEGDPRVGKTALDLLPAACFFFLSRRGEQSEARSNGARALSGQEALDTAA